LRIHTNYSIFVSALSC